MTGSDAAQRLGILGGTFDPPHLGHLKLAAEARRQLSLDHVLWVLTGRSPFKQERQLTVPEVRREMVLATIEGQTGFVFSDLEISRPPPQYTADTVVLLARQYPQAKLFYLMGSDVLEELPRWHRPSVILANCRLGVFQRPGAPPRLESLEEALPGLSGRVDWIQAPPLDITASDIRRRVREGRTYAHLVPKAVGQMIKQHGLYQSETRN